jgi:ABC-type nitrate/sulfonate/bicarbonate transport system substrate-binding protein
MLDGKLRIAPICYHVAHQVPVMVAHEMNYFYDEGLRSADGFLSYHISHDSMLPFGLEKLAISQAMKEKSVDIALDVQPRTVFYQRSRGADLYIIAGWRNQHTNVWVGPPHIKSLADLKGKRVGISDFNSIRHWAIQIQLKKLDWIWIATSNGCASASAVTCSKTPCGPAKSSARRWPLGTPTI